MNPIRFYKTNEQFGEFSNFYRAGDGIVVLGRHYLSSEHYYQSKKFEGHGLEDKVRRTVRCEKVWTIGNSNPEYLRSDWESSKIEVMRVALYAKFTQHESLKRLLVETGDRYIIEATSRDYVWGEGTEGNGLNMLGKLVTELRAYFRNEQVNIDGLSAGFYKSLDYERGNFDVDAGLRDYSESSVLDLDEMVFTRSPDHILRVASVISSQEKWESLSDGAEAVLLSQISKGELEKVSPESWLELAERSLLLERPYVELKNRGANLPGSLSLTTLWLSDFALRVPDRFSKDTCVMMTLKIYVYLLNTCDKGIHGRIIELPTHVNDLQKELCLKEPYGSFICHALVSVSRLFNFSMLKLSKQSLVLEKVLPDTWQHYSNQLKCVWFCVLNYHRNEQIDDRLDNWLGDRAEDKKLVGID